MMNLASQLETLSRLRESGALTEEEFTLAKAKLLADDPHPSPRPAPGATDLGDNRPLFRELYPPKEPESLNRAAESWVELEKTKLALGIVFFFIFVIVILVFVSKTAAPRSGHFTQGVPYTTR